MGSKSSSLFLGIPAAVYLGFIFVPIVALVWRALTAESISDVFGSTQDFSEIMLATAVDHFSNGWVWLVIDRGELRIISMHDAYTPIVHLGLKPLLALDVWEHAYYIDYRNQRRQYADQVLGNLVNWDFVAANLDGRGEHRADQPRQSARQKSEASLGVV